MSDTCLVVTGERPWPPDGGGRLRVARVVEQLAGRLRVVVAHPAREIADERSSPRGVEVVELPWADPGLLAGRVSAGPRMGHYLLGPSVPALLELVTDLRPTTVYWTHSYLPSVAWGRIPARHVVEFANVEHWRALSVARLNTSQVTRALHGWEYLKGLRWEDRVARQADIAVALSETDAAYLRPRARRLLVAPNGLPEGRYVRSRADPVIGAIGSWEYLPNRVGLQQFLATTWPNIRRLVPGAELLVVGRGSKELVDEARGQGTGVQGLGFVPDLSDFYANTSLVLAPATSGGGQQLKVSEGLAYGRIVVGPSHVRASIPAGMPAGAVVATDDLAEPVARLLTDPDGRWRMEQAIVVAAARSGWTEALRPLVDAVVGEATAGRG